MAADNDFLPLRNAFFVIWQPVVLLLKPSRAQTGGSCVFDHDLRLVIAH